MATVLVFSITLLVGVLTSALADRSILSSAVLFLFAGFVAGPAAAGVITFAPQSDTVVLLTELALFTVLFTDSMKAGIGDLKSSWRLPGRALLFGIPLTMAAIALLARYIVGLNWEESFLLGAVLSPTDPVLSSAIVGREEVPKRLRDLLNVESGLNDGLALPVVLVLLAAASQQPVHLLFPLGDAALGIAIGIVVPWASVALLRTRFFSATETYLPLFGVTIGLIVLAATFLSGANAFLGSFAAGATLATVAPEERDAFSQFGELLTELLKLAALLLFGSLITIKFFTETPASSYVFAVLALVAARPAALAIALGGSALTWREWLTAAWFGPKGFSSVTYSLLILTSGIPNRIKLSHLAALVIVGSMVAHSSTDVLVARWFTKAEPERVE